MLEFNCCETILIMQIDYLMYINYRSLHVLLLRTRKEHFIHIISKSTLPFFQFAKKKPNQKSFYHFPIFQVDQNIFLIRVNVHGSGLIFVKLSGNIFGNWREMKTFLDYLQRTHWCYQLNLLQFWKLFNKELVNEDIEMLQS